ncbi:transglycosylase SLT domain-containing protein [Actinoplanes sp. TFC3]|uniref:aggregation-promoting factor C-terminal-like domain-containing protein n=1 Tax=Actinoplanes sp. TFC3 TaxID=1710355 RepID=UPI000830500E|nr:transglycosylase SLT domain-containing protein [Actinoplanes sp. TFC3]
MDRLWSKIGVRATSVGLLVAGGVGGLYVGQAHDEPPQQPVSDATTLALRSDVDEMVLLRARQNQHAAARSLQREAVNEAGEKAAIEAQSAAKKARTSEKRKIAAKRAGTVEIPGNCNAYSGNKAIGCALVLQSGFGISQMPCLSNLWDKESGWNPKAANPSGAYGIPQALPGSKMSSAGSDWRTNPATQIKWGLGYIKGRYSTPCGAWSYFQAHGNY